MNLHSKKARIPIAALGVTALCSAGLGIFASSAFAAGQTLSFLGATGNTATVLTTDVATANAAIVDRAGLAFGVKVSGAANSDTRDLVLQVLTAPASGTINAQKATGNLAPSTVGEAAVDIDPADTSVTLLDAAAATVGSKLYLDDGTVVGTATAVNTSTDVVTLAGPTAATAVTGDDVLIVEPVTNVAASTTSGTKIPNYAVGDNVYLSATTAGTYTLRLFKDTAQDGAYQENADDTTPTFTLNVKAPADAFTLSTPTSVEAGEKGPMVKATSTLSTSDIRGGTPGILAADIADWTTFALSGTNVTGLGGPTVTADYSDTNGFFGYLSTNGNTALTRTVAANPASVSTQLKFNAVNVGTAKTTDVTTNGVTAVTGALATGQTDNTTFNSGTGAVKVRPGTGTVNYTATALDNSVPAKPLSGKTVTFALAAGSGTALTDLTANGAAVPTNGQVTVTTGSDGVAKLAVTSTKTADTNAYTVTASSGAATVTPTTFSTAYAAAAVDDIKITSKAAELTPTVGTASVTVKGSVLDQYGVKFQPTTGNQQVNVTGDATGTAALAAGDFSYTYTPTTPPPAGTTSNLSFAYAGGTNPSDPAAIHWASAAVASTLTLTTPADGAKSVSILDNVAPDPTQGNAGTPAFGNTTGAVTGTVFDSTNTALAYKTVTLKGGNGVWFSTTNSPDADDKLVDTLDVVTNASGAITGAFVYFTKAGEHTITATSGTATKTSTVTVDPPLSVNGYKITVDDVSGAPGSTLIVTGKVTDIFGNAVPSADVDLSTGTSTVGALGDSTIQTNAAGVFSTTFLSGSNQSGNVDLTADIHGLTSNPKPDADLVAAGVTGLTDGVYEAKGKITVGATKLTISAMDKLVAGGAGAITKISGHYLPNTTVEVWAKQAGEGTYGQIDSVETDAQGDWGSSQRITKSTYFIAKADGLSSPSDLTELWSNVSLSTKALGKGKVQLSANGDPNTKTTLSFYRSIAGKDPLLKKITSSASGSGKVTVSLPKGVRSVYVTYKAAGTSLGQSKIMKVTVK
jgi:hypothetical protein